MMNGVRVSSDSLRRTSLIHVRQAKFTFIVSSGLIKIKLVLADLLDARSFKKRIALGT